MRCKFSCRCKYSFLQWVGVAVCVLFTFNPMPFVFEGPGKLTKSASVASEGVVAVFRFVAAVSAGGF